MKKISVFGTSNKRHEKRIPLHPSLFHLIPNNIKPFLIFESGYGDRFGIDDSFLVEEFGGVETRDNLFEVGDIWLLPKPSKNDYTHFSEGKILWGWPHCVQDTNITEAAIVKKMTLIAWEAMYGGEDDTHIFHRNNELAGYASVQHMMMLTGKNGYFGKEIKAAVLGFGATARGAINSLKSLGIKDITVFSKRPVYLIKAPIESVKYKRIINLSGENMLENSNMQPVPCAKELSSYDIIVNCVLQNILKPIMFIRNGELDNFKTPIDIIDVSCDHGLGFYFAKPTGFDNPNSIVESKVNYYSVDHTPTLYWDSASYEITKSIIDFLPHFVENKWKENSVLMSALEIECGHIVNVNILESQNRSTLYPHKICE
ncbi:Rossmann-fold NAD(P)-binding domain-containing protein [Candidatus Enterovibrio escicola]|uniref:Alanine dehydrogenase n=1 Tax=Candidatus Enterovibrio escicola TaxID=1927127 RepID=A0A2A5T0P6_9GAMM|nr:alanine dehydrogenase [Candidatus Enterovibrio escacola]PCS21737.1 Alanine dehydrogenase [Candidatus Enterovibrio escacola]